MSKLVFLGLMACLGFISDASAELKSTDGSFKVPTKNTVNSRIKEDYSLQCWQAGRLIVDEKSLERASSSLSDNNILTFVTKTGLPITVMQGEQTTCLFRPDQ